MTRTRRVVLAETTVAGLTALGFVLSYSSLWRLAEAHGYAAWEALLWPATPDLLAVAMTLLALELAHRHRGPTGEAWTLAALAAVVTLGGNLIGAWPDWIGMVMHAWPPAFAIGAWHVLFRALAADPSRRPDAHPDASPALANAPSADQPARQVIRRLLDHYDGQLTVDQAAEATGVSTRRARQLLLEERRERRADDPAHEGQP